MMNIREEQEKWEHEYMSKYASFSDESQGRDVDEEQCDLRTVYQRDRDRIIHCKTFRRLKQKTQVFLAPEGDHYRTRLTHTLEVAQISRSIARALKLNEDLTEAIALGHDLGHTPYGHAGERALNEVCSHGFNHNIQSIRVVEKLENKGRGLNLTKEVRDGILNHQTVGTPHTMEGKVVRLADKMAYINHDIDDAIRGKILKEEDIPKEYTEVLGNSTKTRLDTMIHNVINNSMGLDDIRVSKDIEDGIKNMRQYMFKHVYINPQAKSEEVKVRKMIIQLFYYYTENYELMPDEYVDMIHAGEDIEIAVCDYIAGMTDTYAVHIFRSIFEPRGWSI